MVRFRPSSSATSGCQPSSRRAVAMSGRRRTGSSAGSGRKLSVERLPVSCSTRSASSSTVCSCGLPMFTGCESGASISASRARTVSLTKQKLRVWRPSPYTVSGRPASACTMKLLTTRPSPGRSRGP